MKLIQELVNQADLKTSDGSDAGSTDIKNKGAEVKFDLMRNTINSDGKVRGADVANYLERAHELNDEVETVLYGLETSDGKVVKVYVNSAQAEAFEAEMKKMLGMEDDIEEAINNLAVKFDIVDVIWPKGEGEEAPADGDDEVSLDDAADIGDPSVEDEDDDMETIASVDDELDGAVPPSDDAPIESEEDQPAPEKKKKKSGEGEGENPDEEGEGEGEGEAEGENPDEEGEAEGENPDKKDDKKKKGDKHSLLKQIGGGLAGKAKVAEAKDPDAHLVKDIKDALENGDDYTAKQLAKLASTPEKQKELLKLIKDEMYKLDEGEVIKADFSKDKGVDNQGIEIPKGYDRFEVDGKKIIGIKGDKKSVVSTTSDERLAQELVRVYNGGKASTTMKPLSLLQAFGSREIAAADEVGIKLTEKPSYWEDFEADGFAAKNNIDQLKLKKLEKTVGKLKEYSGKEIYGTDEKPRGPLKTVLKMPSEDMFIVRFGDGTRYVADQTGARTYIRMWQKIN